MKIQEIFGGENFRPPKTALITSYQGLLLIYPWKLPTYLGSNLFTNFLSTVILSYL
jgi:hypothetical protein